jgi:hypothetical protein
MIALHSKVFACQLLGSCETQLRGSNPPGELRGSGCFPNKPALSAGSFEEK